MDLHQGRRSTDAVRYTRTRPSRHVGSRGRGWGPGTRSSPPRLNVQGAVRRPHVADSNQQDVYQRPYPQAAEAEELAEAFSPLAQVEPVRSEPSEGDAVTPKGAGSTTRPVPRPAPSQVRVPNTAKAPGRGSQVTLTFC